MRQYGMLSAIYMSFYSKKLYKDVVLNWGGLAILYLLFIIMLTWIGFTFQAQYALSHLYDKNSDVIVNQIPVMTFKNGKLSTPEKRPYVVTGIDGKDRLMVIDVSGKIKTLEQAQATILMTVDQVTTKTKPDEIRIYTYPNNLNMIVNSQVINEYIKHYIGFAWILLFPIVVLFSFIYRFIQVLVYSIVGKIFSAITKAKLSYGQVMQITMIALTPAMIVCAVLNYFNIMFPFQGLFYFGLAMAYVLFGVKANK